MSDASNSSKSGHHNNSAPRHELKSYSDAAFTLTKPDFEALHQLAAKRLKAMQLNDRAEADLFNSLDRGTSILQRDEQVDKYMHAFGRKHYLKFNTLFRSVPKQIFDGFFDVVDWGCGPGLGLISLNDFCRKELLRKIESQVREITLIEPSVVALRRAKTHSELLFPEARVNEINKRFEELGRTDFAATALGVPRLHLFSNVLDLDLFRNQDNKARFFDLIRESFRRDEYYLCVSPTYNKVASTFMTFVSSLADPDVTRDTLLEPTQKVFTKENDGTDVRMTGVAVRIRSTKEQAALGKIKNKPLLSAMNARRDSTVEQRALVRYISMHCGDDEYDILYRPNLMGDSPDMLVLKKKHVAKLIYVCDAKDLSHESLQKIVLTAQVAESAKYRLFDLISPELRNTAKLSNMAYGLVQCVVYLPHLSVEEGQLKRLLADAELKLQATASKQRTKDQLLKGWQYRELITRNKPWRVREQKLMNEKVYDELKGVLMPHFNGQPGQKVTFRNGSQQHKMSISVAGARQKVFGVYGSGKTTVLAVRAISAYERTHKPVLILTFNITLRSYIEGILHRQFGAFDRNQFYVVNYHEFIKGECHYIKRTKDIPYDDVDFFRTHRDAFRKYGVILIDEAQDYSLDWFRIITEAFLADDGEYVIFGDEKQNIYGQPIDKAERKIRTNIPGQATTLTGCYRSNPEIVERIVAFQKNMFNLRYNIDDIKVGDGDLLAGTFGVTGVIDVGEKDTKRIAATIMKVQSAHNVAPADIAVLGSSTDMLRTLEKHYRDVTKHETESMFIKQEEWDDMRAAGQNTGIEIDTRERCLKLHFNAKAQRIKFSTIHSFKGFEANTIIAIIQSAHIEEDDTEVELIYTGLTRARQNLFIINYGRTRHGESLKSLFGHF